jgi:antitoxin CptB
MVVGHPERHALPFDAVRGGAIPPYEQSTVTTRRTRVKRDRLAIGVCPKKPTEPTLMSETSDSLDIRRKRAVWRAHHRGTKEMDWLLGKYADAKLPTMDGDALEAFERLMALPDPDLNAWILDPALLTSREFAADIDSIRRFHKLGENGGPAS